MTEQRASGASVLKRTPLYALHVEMGARMAPFAGYEMPIQYARGVLKEHLHTRSAAGLFDVSHMGQIRLRPRSGRLADAARALERLVPVDVVGLQPARQRYAFFTNESGGVVDDLVIGNIADQFILTVNASCKHRDEQCLCDTLSDVCTIEVLEDRVLLALQGPVAESVLAPLSQSSASMRFMDIQPVQIAGVNCLVGRSGYTGEDGYEISVAARDAEKLVRTLLRNAAVLLIGLGARDSLRVEAGLCLYGSDIDEKTTPVEAKLEWAIQSVRRRGGARAGNFPGADVILEQLERGAPRYRVGLKPRGRAPVRAGVALYADSSAIQPVGAVTSGTYGPSAGEPVTMGYVPSALSAVNTLLYADVRGNRLPVEVTKLPFIPHRYKRT
jgi:glycine cleavage system T protein (aminomethyltransferase)